MTKPQWSFAQPAEGPVREFLQAQEDQTFSYRPVGATKGRPPLRYDYDDNQMQLGAGKDTFDRACAALAAWKMFPGPWTRITPAESGGIKPGLTVAMQAHALGLWWLNACRIVYTVDELLPVRRQGFAYGTLPAHVEEGEELFTIEHWPDDTVWYRVQAFSRPNFWLVKMARPVARLLQRKFVRDSGAAMLQAVRTPE